MSFFIISLLFWYFFGKVGLNVLVFFFCTYLWSARWFVQITAFYVILNETRLPGCFSAPWHLSAILILGCSSFEFWSIYAVAKPLFRIWSLGFVFHLNVTFNYLCMEQSLLILGCSSFEFWSIYAEAKLLFRIWPLGFVFHLNVSFGLK